MSLGDRSGLVYFFDASNVEMLVKVLDACNGFGAYWVFYAATTDLGLEVRVTDTVTGVSKTYGNPLGQTAEPVQDYTTFTSCN